MFRQEATEHPYQEKFLLWKAKLSRHKGGYYIHELWNGNGKRIHATQLYTLDQKQACKYVDDDPEAIYMPQWQQPYYTEPELPVELSDHKAVSATRKAIIAFTQSMLDARENNDLGRAADMQEQLEKAVQYLQEVLDHKGGIKKTNDIARKHSQLISHAVQGFLHALGKEEPELAEYLKQHLVIGIQCYWSHDPKSRINNGGIHVLENEPNYPDDDDRDAI